MSFRRRRGKLHARSMPRIRLRKRRRTRRSSGAELRHALRRQTRLIEAMGRTKVPQATEPAFIFRA